MYSNLQTNTETKVNVGL